MKYIFNLLFLILGINIFSQIKMTTSPLNQKCMSDCVLKVTLTNISHYDYIIPLDTTALKAYDKNGSWLNFIDSKKADKTLCLELSIQDFKTKKVLTSLTKNKNIELDLINTDSLFAGIKTENNIYQKKVELWKKRYGINNDRFAQKNIYLLENLLFLKSGKELSFYVKFDTSFQLEKSFTSMESYYVVIPNNKYYATLKLDIPKKIKNYFISKQMEEYKKYKIFTGKINSNNLSVFLEKEGYLLSE